MIVCQQFNYFNLKTVVKFALKCCSTFIPKDGKEDIFLVDVGEVKFEPKHNQSKHNPPNKPSKCQDVTQTL